MSPDEVGRARPPGAPKHPQRKKLPHERPLWLRPEAQIFFITVCCEPRGKNQLCSPKVARAIFDSVEFRNQNFVWYAHLVCLMPDHLHARGHQSRRGMRIGMAIDAGVALMEAFYDVGQAQLVQTTWQWHIHVE